MGDKLSRAPPEIKGNKTVVPHTKTEFAPQCLVTALDKISLHQRRPFESNVHDKVSFPINWPSLSFHLRSNNFMGCRSEK